MLDHNSAGALRLALCMAPWWYLRGRSADGRPVLERALAAWQSAPSGLKAAAEVWLGLQRERGSDGSSPDNAHFERAIELATADGPSPLLVDAICGGSRSLIHAKRSAEAHATVGKALEMAKASGYASGEAYANAILGYVAFYAGDYDTALMYADAAERVDASLLTREAARVRASLMADSLEATGATDRGERLALTQIEDARREEARGELALHLDVLARIEMKTERHREAAAHIDEAIRLASENGNQDQLAYMLDTALVWAAERDPHTAAVIWGADQALNHAIGNIMDSPFDLDFRDGPIKTIGDAIGDKEMQRAEQHGKNMPLGAALERIHGLLQASEQAPTGKHDPAKLSKRERELLTLVTDGLTDAQIAERLYISVKTVHSHLDCIRDKTGARRRPELIQFASTLAAADAPAS